MIPSRICFARWLSRVKLSSRISSWRIPYRFTRCSTSARTLSAEWLRQVVPKILRLQKTAPGRAAPAGEHMPDRKAPAARFVDPQRRQQVVGRRRDVVDVLCQRPGRAALHAMAIAETHSVDPGKDSVCAHAPGQLGHRILALSDHHRIDLPVFAENILRQGGGVRPAENDWNMGYRCFSRPAVLTAPLWLMMLTDNPSRSGSKSKCSMTFSAGMPRIRQSRIWTE